VIVFNGEIYNYRELRRELESAGKIFVGTSDTEVVLALYDKEGEKCFERLGGMFAIALYDVTKKRLLLARDPLGKKPLYWGVLENTLIFASEPKALLAHPVMKKEIDLPALNMYLAHDYVPTPFSIWKGIRKLEPGTYLSYVAGKSETARFWNPSAHPLRLGDHAALESLDRLLAHAVEERLVADVPLGVFLSGGLDSSTIAWYASEARRKTGKSIDTFAVGFSERSFDESSHARLVAEHIKATHHEKIVSPDDALAALPIIMATLDEPMADASIIPTYLLAKFARESVTVALGGDGGDELFAGYPTFQAERMVPLYRALPSFAQGTLRGAAGLLPTSTTNFSLKFKLERFIDGAGEESMVRRHMRWLGSFNDDARSALLSEDARHTLGKADANAFAEEHFASFLAPDPRNRLLWTYQHSYMMDEVMVKVDRGTMAASLEARAPFLAREVVAFVNRLPYDMKLRGMTSKYLLKKLMRGRLPSHIIDRPKKGFGVPVGAWIRGPLRDWAEDLLSPQMLNRSGLFEMAEVERIKNEHMEGKRDNRKELWNLIALSLWQDKWM